MLIWPGMVGNFMSYLPVTLIIALSASLLVALVFNPTLCAYFMTVPPKTKGKSEGKFLSRYRKLLGWLLEPAPDEGHHRLFLPELGACVGFRSLRVSRDAHHHGRHAAREPRPGDLLGREMARRHRRGRLRSPGRRMARVEPGASCRLEARNRPALGRHLDDGSAFRVHSCGLRRCRTGDGVLSGDGTRSKSSWTSRRRAARRSRPRTKSCAASNPEPEIPRTFYIPWPISAQKASASGAVTRSGVVAAGFRTTAALRWISSIARARAKNSLLTMEEVREAITNLYGAEIKVDKPQQRPTSWKARHDPHRRR